MPEVSVRYRKQKLATSTGRGSIPASTQDFRELARTGQTLTAIGLGFLEKHEQAEFHSQFNTAKTETLKRFYEFQQNRVGTDPETWNAELERLQAEISTELSGKFTNNRAKNEYGLWYERYKPEMTKQTLDKKRTIDVRNFVANQRLNVEITIDLIANAETEPEALEGYYNLMSLYGQEPATTTDKEGNQIPKLDKDGLPIHQAIKDDQDPDPVYDSPKVKDTGYKAAAVKATAKRKSITEGRIKIGVEAQAFAIAAEQGYPAAEEWLRNPETRKQLLDAGMSREDAKSLITDVSENVKFGKAKDEQVVEEQREKERDTINNSLYKDLDFEKAIDEINDSSLDETEQGRKMKEARDLQLAWAKGGKDEKQEKVKSDLLIKISKDPRKYDEDFLSDEALAGRIHPSHLPQLTLWRDKVVKGLTGTISAKKGYNLLETYSKKGVFGRGVEGANLYIETTDNFTEFLLEEDRSAQDVIEYIENMTPEASFLTEFWLTSGLPIPGLRRKLRTGAIRKQVRLETERLAETEIIESVKKEPEIIIDPTKEPTTKDEFIETANSITDPTDKRLYVDKWLNKF